MRKKCLFDGEKRTKICKYEQMDFFRADLRGQMARFKPKPPKALAGCGGISALLIPSQTQKINLGRYSPAELKAISAHYVYFREKWHMTERFTEKRSLPG